MSPSIREEQLAQVFEVRALRVQSLLGKLVGEDMFILAAVRRFLFEARQCRYLAQRYREQGL